MSEFVLTRRQLSQLAAAIPLGVPAIARAQGAKPRRIIVNSSGGTVATAMRRAFYKPFEDAYGITVVDTSPVDDAKLITMVKSGNVEWTVAELSGAAVRLAKGGYLEKIDDTIVDRSHLPAEARNPYLYAIAVQSTVLAYNTKAFANRQAPDSWADFWNFSAFPGKRSLRNSPDANLEFALLADGVSPSQLYPLDMDRAFRKLDQLRPQVAAWWTTGAQPVQMLIDGEVAMASGFSGRFFDLMQHQDSPARMTWNGGAVRAVSFGIPKGAPAAEWGQRMLATFADPKHSAQFAAETGYPGPDPNAVSMMDPKIQPLMVTYPANLKVQFWQNLDWWDENIATATDRWNRWVVGG